MYISTFFCYHSHAHALLTQNACKHSPSNIHSTAAEDYDTVLATLHFQPDHSAIVVVKIDILDDVLVEGEERFSVELTAFDLSIILFNSVAEIVIEDDDDGKIKTV